MKIFHVGSHQFWESLQELHRELRFRIAQVTRCHSENGISYSENGISHSETCSENIPEHSESSENDLFTPRAFFLNLAWSPGFGSLPTKGSPLALFKAIFTLKVKTFISCYRTPGPRKGFRRSSEGVSEGVSEGFLKGFCRVLEGVSRGPLLKPFKNPSKTLQRPLQRPLLKTF